MGRRGSRPIRPCPSIRPRQAAAGRHNKKRWQRKPVAWGRRHGHVSSLKTPSHPSSIRSIALDAEPVDKPRRGLQQSPPSFTAHPGPAHTSLPRGQTIPSNCPPLACRRGGACISARHFSALPSDAVQATPFEANPSAGCTTCTLRTRCTLCIEGLCIRVCVRILRMQGVLYPPCVLYRLDEWLCVCVHVYGCLSPKKG